MDFSELSGGEGRNPKSTLYFQQVMRMIEEGKTLVYLDLEMTEADTKRRIKLLCKEN